MSDDESDAEFERRYPQKRPGMPLWAILLIVFGSVGFFGCLGVILIGAGGLMFSGAATVPPGPPPQHQATVENGPPPVPKVMSRGTFEHLVIGKTTAQVKADLGEPPMSVGENGEETWTYRGRTMNEATDKFDAAAEVVFRGGKAIRVDYN